MTTRREFLQSSLGVTAGAGIGSMLPIRRADAAVAPDVVQLRPEIEPVVRLIENTPRDRCFEMMVEQLRKGLPYRRFLGALFLAGIRNVNPQPPGFKFHCVFVIHSCHQVSLDVPAGDRLLPMFWALDAFKDSQARDIREGDFRLRPVEGRVPPPEKAIAEFHSAMEDWDEERADRAIVSLVRNRGSHEVIQHLWQFGARDYRNIGHKAIFVANTWRTLQTIGWQHAEPACRSLVLGLLDFGKKEEVNLFTGENQCFAANLEASRKWAAHLTPGWANSHFPGEKESAQQMLAAMRSAGGEEASALALKLVLGGATAQPVWDAVHLAAGELMMRQPGIYGIHTVTSVNGLRYAFESAADDQTRLLMMLQAVGWMCQFREFMASKQKGLQDLKIDRLEPEESAPVEDIFAEVSRQPGKAAAMAMQFASDHSRPDAFTSAARQLILRKATDAHDYKYSVAAFEDYRRVSPIWRPHMLATSVYNLKGSTLPDSSVMQRAREAIKSFRG